MENQTTEPKLSKTQQKKLAAAEHNKKVQQSNESNRLPTTEEREELETLSKEVFGSTSRYLTFMTKGETVPVTETITEYVPDETGGEGVTREVQIPVTYKNSKTPMLKVVKHTVESVKVRLLEIKEQQEKMRAAFAKAQADQQAAEIAKRAEQEKAKRQQEVQRQLGGSAV